jgi:hypothetical protein
MDTLRSTFTVVVWNMQHKESAWEALARLQADVALLNEARVPDAGIDVNVIGGHHTEGRDDYERPWAAAVVSPHALHEIDDAQAFRYGRPLKVQFINSRPGSWVATQVDVPGLGGVTAVSLYGLMDEKSDASVHRSLSELAPLLEDPRYREHVVLGGDLNTWTGWAAGSRHLAVDRVVLDRIRVVGLVDCLEQTRDPGRLEGCPCSLGEDCMHTRTRLDPRRPDVPYQMDYLFASPAMAKRLAECAAPTDDPWPAPSDHYPIQATFAV